MMDEKKEYIERGAAKRAIYEYICGHTMSKFLSRELLDASKGGAEGAMYELDYVPAADVAPVVHGEWCWEGKFKACSKCGSYVEWNETLGANFWKYCPFCGAKMDGGKHETD